MATTNVIDVSLSENDAKDTTPKRRTAFIFGSKKSKCKARGRKGGRKPKLACFGSESVPIDEETVEQPVQDAPRLETDQAADRSTTNEAIRPESAKKRKMSFFDDLYESDREEPDFFHGYFPIHMSFLVNLISCLACPVCFDQGLRPILVNMTGSSARIEVVCPKCGVLFNRQTSPNAGTFKDINVRMVLAAKECGIGFEKLKAFFSHLDIPGPMHVKTFQNISAKVHAAATEAATEVMKKAADCIIQRQGVESSIDSPPQVIVSYDGTWQKRGHSSHNGVGVAIELETGLVLDSHCVSNYCHGCLKGPKPSDPAYISWKANHKCQRNFDGSSNAMETHAAVIIFNRSVASRGLIYKTMLCDGDAKAHHAVVAAKPYQRFEVEVDKQDCVNHIAKRCYNGLDTMKKSNKSALNRKLTQAAMTKITNTYAVNLKLHAPDVVKMKEDVLGGFYHMMSTDDAPNHSLCPSGDKSWCWYNRTVALGLPANRKHTPTFSHEVGTYVLPIIERLTDPNLLERCARMKTQNANESFNSLIWKRCPKTEFASRMSVETAVALATIAFNCGPGGIKLVCQKLGLVKSSTQDTYLEKAAAAQILKASKDNNRESRFNRKKRKLEAAKKADADRQKEGETYGAGQFNL